MKTPTRYLLALLLAVGLLFSSFSSARAGVFINVGIAPPALPVCVQPACPGLGYIWTPGYWAWDAGVDSYYWVPGAWAMAPEVGFLWTPGYWGCNNGAYFYNAGYWGPQVGFYGGINYGFGYNGNGYYGGYWRNRQFYYNREVNNVRAIEASRLYSRSVESGYSRTSFNGPGGVTARATDAQLAAAREHHVGATPAQNAQIRAAEADPGMRYSTNHGNPAVTGTARAGTFHSTTASTENRTTAQRSADTAFTGESRAATERAATERTASETGATEQARTESRLTEERTARANEERTAAATENRRAEVARSESHVAERSHSESHSFATASHAPAYHASMAHASAPHAGPSGGGHGGGGGAAHASAGGGRPR